jgi:hypothetical protein
MGYRDDELALDNQRQILEREARAMEQELDGLRGEAEGLRRTISRKRVQLAISKLGSWMRKHPKTMVLLTVIIAIISGVWTQSTLEKHRHRRLVEARLGKGCAYRLSVEASVRGAGVLVEGLRVGKSPAEVPVCPGTYHVRVTHRKTLPWQRVVKIPDDIGGGRKVLSLTVPLIPWRPSHRPRDGILVFSNPPGALLFADGDEVGRTPVFLGHRRGKGQLLLALHAHGHLTRVQRVDSKPAVLWFHMGRVPPEKTEKTTRTESDR